MPCSTSAQYAYQPALCAPPSAVVAISSVRDFGKPRWPGTPTNYVSHNPGCLDARSLQALHCYVYDLPCRVNVFARGTAGRVEKPNPGVQGPQFLSPLFLLDSTIRSTKLTITAASNNTASAVGPNRSSKPACPRTLIDLARQWYVLSAYKSVHTATPVKQKAEILAALSPKLSMPTARAPTITAKFSQDKKVRSLAK